MALRAWLLALAALIGVGCEGDPHEASLRVVLDADTRANTAAVVVEIREGGCDGTRVAADVLRLGMPMAMPRRLGKGRFGFVAEVRDDTCNAIARGCEEKTLPTDSTITIAPAPVMPPESQCAMAMCTAGLCQGDIPPDAGPDRPDTGPDLPDTGPPPPCETEGMACPTGGICHGGACCTGCWTGTACELGTGRTACGTGGGACSTCMGSDLCAGGMCVPPGAATTHFVLAPRHSLFLNSDGRFWSSGNDMYMQFGPRAAAPTNVFGGSTLGTRYVELAATQFVTCGLDGADLSCWGTNSFGLLGVGDGNTMRVEASPVSVSGTWATVSGSSNHICAISAADQNIHCWGEGLNGKLGNGDTMSRNTPTAIAGGSAWIAVATGSEHTCGIRSDRTLWCWGRNEFGQIGNGTSGSGMLERTPAQVGSMNGWTAVSAKGDHTCGLRGGELWCWGNGGLGRLGTGNEMNQNTPQRVGTRTDWTAVSLGLYHSCGLAGGRAYCWGFSVSVGHGMPSNETTPREVLGDFGDWTAIAAGWRHSCGVRAGATPAYCWGINADGQLGTGSMTDVNRPTEVTFSPSP